MLPSAIEFSARFVFALCSFSLMAVILLLIRKNAIQEKYVLLWLPLGIGFFLVSLFPELLLLFSARIQLHYITVVLLGVIIVYTGILLYFTTRLSQLREDVKKLAQEITLTRNEKSGVKSMEKSNEKSEQKPLENPIEITIKDSSWVLGSQDSHTTKAP